MARGFGSPAKEVKVPLPSEKLQKKAMDKAGPSDVDTCPCGQGRAYKQCCARYHGGVKEPDAAALLRARYSAFARGLAPYLIRTTHPDNPDMKRGGAEQLKADCEETSRRLVFKSLEVGQVEEAAGNPPRMDKTAAKELSQRELFQKQMPGQEEATISFKVVFAYRHGTTTDNQVLVERSRFVKEGDRWLYLEKLSGDVSSGSNSDHGPRLLEEQGPPRLAGALALGKFKTRRK